MSDRADRRRVSAERRRRAADRLLRRASRRLAPQGAIALVDAVADALEQGHVGAARDLLRIVVSDHAADEIASVLLDLEAPAPALPEEAG